LTIITSWILVVKVGRNVFKQRIDDEEFLQEMQLMYVEMARCTFVAIYELKEIIKGDMNSNE